MKITLLTILLFLAGILQPADPYISSKDYDVNSFHRGKQSSKSPKRVYIQKFRVLFEVFEEASASTKGSTNNRANRATTVSGTKTSMGVQLSGVDIPDFQKIVDEAYADFAAQLEADGYEIISAEEAGKTDYYSGYELVKGGASSTDQATGFVMVTPQGYDYWVKGIANDGREKGTFTDTSSKLSKDLGDAYVAEATFIFPFVALDASSTSFANYASSKVKADINLRMAAAIGATDNEQMSLGKFAKGFTQSSTSARLASQVRFVAGHLISSPAFDSSTGLKRDVYFEDIFAETKLVEVTSAEVATFSKTAYPQLVMVSGGELNLASHYVACNKDNYVKSAKGSISELIGSGISNFKELVKD
ncbi:hypothetical protein [Algoriphagus yeomjeoni]|uniref:Uncharacterized protein n=1 Tax=Algoriphagus yeomjeoni TaxID=291403 RepID=A0A327PFJ2_9BACT|nr:hypothetical protein [Algoriphagus yeomjeoni]RAI90004.1 hypothetical protein LV83_02006 [Algoriphagus yeomjeoni]